MTLEDKIEAKAEAIGRQQKKVRSPAVQELLIGLLKDDLVSLLGEYYWARNPDTAPEYEI